MMTDSALGRGGFLPSVVRHSTIANPKTWACSISGSRGRITRACAVSVEAGPMRSRCRPAALARWSSACVSSADRVPPHPVGRRPAVASAPHGGARPTLGSRRTCAIDPRLDAADVRIGGQGTNSRSRALTDLSRNQLQLRLEVDPRSSTTPVPGRPRATRKK